MDIITEMAVHRFIRNNLQDFHTSIEPKLASGFPGGGKTHFSVYVLMIRIHSNCVCLGVVL